jgi:5'-nucleotidase
VPRSRSRGRLLAALAAATTLSLTPVASVALLSPASSAAPTGATAAAAAKRNVRLQILALNDLHGQLEPSTSTSSGTINGTPAGGAEFLATHLQRMRRNAARTGRHSVTVSAGDLIGATPLVSAAFHDEPTIEAMNRLGLQVTSVGNHEFDEGWRELLRMQRGGCLRDGAGKDNQDSCPGTHRFRGARFQYLSANVLNTRTGRTVFPAVTVKRYGGIKVGFIGMTLENTPNIVTRSGVAGLRFTDEVATANAVARRLDDRGVKSIVLLLHEGGYPADPSRYNACRGLSGAVVDINRGLSPRIDAVISGHTHQAYKCRLKDPDDNRRLVTSASSLGRVVTNIHLSLDPRTRDVVRPSAKATNVVVTRDVDRSPVITALLGTYNGLVAEIRDKVIGRLAGGATSVDDAADPSGESALGNLIADSQRADPSTVTGARTPDVAFMNPGGIRTDLVANAAGEVTFGAAFAVQPFNNYVVSMDMTGAQLLELLGQQWSGVNTAERPRILQVSGITYSYRHPAGGPYTLLPGTVKVNGATLDPARTYRVAANSFLSDGGDGFSAFAAATDKFFGGLDIDALATYLAAHDPFTPAPTDRITVAP